MQDLETKQKILDEIMSMMDEKDGERLKSHPKLAAASMPEEKPGLELGEDESSENPEMEKKEGDLDPETVQKILEMYKDLK